MFIHGGHSDHKDKCYGDAYRFNPRNAKWDLFPVHVGAVKIPPSRRCHTTILAGNRVFLIGGITIVHSDKFFMSLEGRSDEQTDWDEELSSETNNFYVLDLRPSLKTLCMMSVIGSDRDRSTLPRTIQMQMSRMFTVNDMIRTRFREQ